MDDLDIRHLYGKQTEKIGEKRGASVYETIHDGGRGRIEKYELFGGIHLYLMDLFVERLDYSGMSMKFSDNLITINHCEKGRFEGEFPNGEYIFLGEGDISVNMPEKNVVRNAFPLGRFQGLMLVIEAEEAKSAFLKASEAFGKIPICFDNLKKRLLSGNQLLIYRSSERLRTLFSAFYDENCADRNFYFKIKILEILYYLDSETTECAKEGQYFEKNKIQAVKQAREWLIQHLDQRYTLKEVSLKFDIPMTALKDCFKAVYGMPVNTYMQAYRVCAAAKLLRETTLSAAEISERVGYANQSKFTEVFKRRMAATPSDYRKENGLLEQTAADRANA